MASLLLEFGLGSILTPQNQLLRWGLSYTCVP